MFQNGNEDQWLPSTKQLNQWFSLEGQQECFPRGEATKITDCEPNANFKISDSHRKRAKLNGVHWIAAKINGVQWRAGPKHWFSNGKIKESLFFTKQTEIKEFL